MELTQMRYFVLVAENGSTARAAAEAMVSQSTISKSILRLEQELELPLFDREGNRLVLNPAGKEFFQQVRPILSAVHRLPDFVKSRHRVRRPYRINVSAAQPVMGQFVHWFLAREPDAEVSLLDADWIDDCDLSISASPSSRQEDSILLLEEPVLLAVPKKLLAPGESTLELLRLEGMKLILPAEGSDLRSLIDRQILSLPAVMEVQAVCARDETLRQLVELGDGAAFWPQKTWPRPDPGTTALVPILGMELRRRIYALLPPQRAQDSQNTLLSAVREYFAALSGPSAPSHTGRPETASC